MNKRHDLQDAVILAYDETTQKPVGAYPDASSRREHGNFCVVGPPGSGKGLWITTQLLNWRHSVVVVDLKGETYARTAHYRRQLGQCVYVLDPRSGTGTRYNPVAAVDRATWEQLAYEIMSQGVELRGEDNFWATSGVPLVLAVWLAAQARQVPHIPLTVEVLGLGLAGIIQSLLEHHPQDEEIMRYLAEFLGNDARSMNPEQLLNPSKLLDSKFASVVASFKPFCNDNILRIFSGHELYDIEGLFYEPATIYVMADETNRQSFAAFLRLVMVSLGDSLIKHGDRTVYENRRPVLFLFDEFGRVQSNTVLTWLDTMRSRGIVLVLFIQKFSQVQVKGNWEEDENSIHHWIIFKPTLSHARAGQFIVRNSGITSVMVDSIESTSYNTHELSTASRSRALKERPVIRPEDIETWSSNTVYYVLSASRTTKNVAVGPTPWGVFGQSVAQQRMKPAALPPSLPALVSYALPITRPAPTQPQGARGQQRSTRPAPAYDLSTLDDPEIID